jgi:hypothetical protein
MKNKANIHRNSSQSIIQTDEIVLGGILTVLTNQNSPNWIGTMTNLQTALNRVLSRAQRNRLPGSPSALRLAINRVVNRLRNRGVGVRFGRTTDHSRTRFVRFSR